MTIDMNDFRAFQAFMAFKAGTAVTADPDNADGTTPPVPGSKKAKPVTAAEKATAKRMNAHRLSQEAQEEVAEAEEEAADTGGADTLYALRHGAVSGYGAITRYGVGLNKAFGKGWTLLRKGDGGNGKATWDRIEMERKSFVALCKDRGVGNPANYWKNAKKAAVAAEGGAKKGTVEPRAFKARLLTDCSKLLVATYRDADAGKQAANVKKAGELLENAIQTLGGDINALKAQAKKALPGQPKGS
jgi:hypothetical protein